MSESRFSMPLFMARAAGERILDTLRPVIEFGVVCGSVRRERAEAHDLDIVVVPRRADGDEQDLWWGEHSEEFRSLVAECPRWTLRQPDPLGADRPGAQRAMFSVDEPPRIAPNARQVTLWSRKQPELKIELWLACRANVGWITLLRTGDAHFTKHLVTAAKANLTPNQGFVFEGGVLARSGSGEAIVTQTEQSVFDALGIPFIEPRHRDRHALDRLFRRRHGAA